jgi:hypothetical protein
MNKLLLAAIAVALLAATVRDASASTLYGSEVTLTGDYPTLGTPIIAPNTQTIGPGVEYPVGSLVPISGVGLAPESINIGPSSIEQIFTAIRTLGGGMFNGFIFDFGASAPTILDASIDPSSSFDASQLDLSFGTNEVTINEAGLHVTPSSTILIDLTLAQSATAPEPSSLALCALALLAIGGILRRKPSTPSVS